MKEGYKMKIRLKKVIAGVMAAVIICNCFHTTAGISSASGLTEAVGTAVDNSTEISSTSDNNSNNTAANEETTENTTIGLEEGNGGQEITTEISDPVEPDEGEESNGQAPQNEEGLSSQSNMFRAAAAASSIPATVEELEAGTEVIYNISTYDDVLALQELSKASSLEGYTFRFGKLNNSTNAWDFTSIPFTGFGSEEYPFKGTLEEYYTSGTTFKTKYPLFQYLGSGAAVTNFAVNLSNASSGIAQNFVITDDAAVIYTNVTLTGSISNSGGAAGALYGTVKNDGAARYEIAVADTGINVKELTVSGKTAGGYIGETSGDVKLVVSSGANVAKTVTSVSGGTAAGGIVGRLGNGSSFEVISEITIGNGVSGTGSVGGLIGICDNAAVTANRKITKNTDIAGTVNAGGFAGLATDSQIQVSGFVLNGMVRASNSSASYAGGVIGQYITTDMGAETLLNISKAGVSSKRIGAGTNNSNGYSCGAGGIIGYINGDNVTISDIQYNDSEYAFLPDLRYYGYNTGTGNAFSATGGIAGRVSGKNVELSDINVSFVSGRGIAGRFVGDILGYVEMASKVRLSDIVVTSSYTNYAAGYNGGVAGYVDKGCVIALCNNIDLSGITYLNSQTGLYAAYRGYVAGAQQESLLYLEKDAVLVKNEKAGNLEDAVWRADYYYKDWQYILDDVGTYGGIYRNVEDENGNLVIQYDNAYGQEVTGIVDYADGKYQLAHIADALRLAIALGTFDASDSNYALRFGQNCFQADAAGKTLLASDYQVSADLDFSLAGIYSLCRNDAATYEFTGTMEGSEKADGTYPVISLCIASKQNYGGLFPKIKDASFKNLNLSGYLYYTKNCGGIAYYAEGSVTLEGMGTDMRIRTSSYSEYYTNNVIYYYGGFIGQYNLQNNSFICRDCVAAPVIDNIRMQQIAGGMVGYINTGKTAVTGNNIIVTGTTIKSRMSADTKFLYNYNAYSQARISGMFACIGYDVTGNQSGAAALGGSVANATYAKLELSGITVDGAIIDLSSVTTNKGNVRASGGFLGYDWNNVEVSAGSITVKNQSVINSLGHVGGLITTLAGRLDLKEVSLESMEMHDKTGSQTFSGLLVGDARYAVITLTEKDYRIDSSVIVEGYSNFDEIAGVNYALTGNNINNNNCAVTGNYSEGGIVNIIKPEFGSMTADTYESYQNRIVTGNNQYTRYYYNLFGSDYDTEKIIVTNNSAEIGNPHQLMLWHLYKYMNANIQRFITPYFVNAAGAAVSPNNVAIWNLSGVLDMDGYSFYPARVSGGTYNAAEGTVLKLYGETIENKENRADREENRKVPSTSTKQHYMMHASLFYNASGVTVQGLTLQGTAANLGGNSGALCAGSLSGTNNIKEITCDGIRLADYPVGSGDAAGLLVGKVSDGATLNMDEIKTTTAYEEGKFAAAALIGTVGGPTAVNVHVNFQHMQVEDEKEKVFKYASFIYYYDSVDNSNTNKSFGLYTFTKEDFDNGVVTFGSELSYGVHYSDKDSDPELMAICNTAEDTYNPYVYKVKMILVNPRNGNLDKGCGTYEDPYIIDDVRQFLTLYCYLTGSTSYNSVFNVVDSTTLKKWSVNPIGGGSDDKRCNKDITPHTSIEYGEEKFPSRDELRTAYYRIEADLNLADVNQLDLNEYVMARDFSGIGTTEYPFSGVIVGKKADGNGSTTEPVIILPTLKSDSTRNWEYYGLIQYMKGAVVKDLNIQVAKDTESNETTVIGVNQAAGGVAAVALGGDNIIDNVKVDVKFTVQNTANSSSKTGGYVGYVKKGSVIIRNMEKEDVENYEAGYLKSGTRIVIDAQEQKDYKKNGRVIGWVEDGCVLYEGDNINDTSMVLEQTDFGFTDGSMLLSYSFPIVNGNYLSRECDTDKIQIAGTVTDGFTITMKNAAQMEIAAMALNSDAFSIYNSGQRNTNHVNGYDYTAICRKAQYNDLGQKRGDYTLATTQDDYNGYYPYLYQYMDFGSVTDTDNPGSYRATQKVDDNGRRLSLLNWSDGSAIYNNVDAGDIVTTYQLEGGAVYDLSGFGRSFRGFGALYIQTINNISYSYSLFKANFNGNNATVTAAMVRDWDSGITTTGLFNNLTTCRSGGFNIENITISNSCFKNGLAQTSATGSVAGYVKGVWNFNNIKLERNTAPGDADGDGSEELDVEGKSYTGGMVGYIHYYSNSQNDAGKQKIHFTGCKISGTDVYSCRINGNTSVGGLAGYVDGLTSNTSTYYGDIYFTDCHVSNGLITTANGNIGGFAGRVGHAYSYNNANYGASKGTLAIEQSEGDTEPAVYNTKVQSSYTSGTNSAGGLIGEYITYYNNADTASGTPARNLTISGVIIDGLSVVSAGTNNQYYGVGGLCGGSWNYAAEVTNVTIKNSSIGYSDDSTISSNQRLSAGGLFGSVYSTTVGITDGQVSGCQIGSYSNRAGGYIGDCNATNLMVGSDNDANLIQKTLVRSETYPAGGLIGANTNNLSTGSWTIHGVQVKNCHIQSKIENSDNYCSGGIIGRNYNSIKVLNMSGITVGDGTDIEGSNVGGLIGYACGTTKMNLSDHIYVGCSLSGGDAVPDTQYTNIYAYWNAGGLFGYDAITEKEMSSADVQVQKTKIGAYVHKNSSDTAAAGGVAGRKNFYAGDCKYDHFVLKNCMVAANHASGTNVQIRCGGIYGQVYEQNASAAGIYFYSPKLSNNNIGYAKQLTGLTALKDLEQDSQEVYLLTGNNTGAYWDTLNINENNVGTYSMRIGNFAGEWKGSSTAKQLCILRPELTYDSGFTGSRPAIDVGNASTGTQNNNAAYGYGYPYAWRQYCHIVYFEPDETLSADSIIDAGLLVNDEHEYLYGSISDRVLDYDENASGADYLADYNLNVQIDSNNKILDYYTKCVKDKELNGVKIVNADGGTAQAILDSVVGIMTNIGGISGDPSTAGMKKLLNVSAAKAKITTDGKIVADTGDTSIVVDNNKIKYRELTYDDMGDDGSYTITLLYFRYGWEGADAKNHYETIYVPVYVVERIAFYSNLHIMEGENYSLEDAHDSNISYSGNVTVAHDSTYTLFAELAYGTGRMKNAYRDFKVAKTLTFQRATGQTPEGEYTWGEAVIPEGMQFTLVDVQTGQPYYYTIPEGGVTSIDFTTFKDAKGQSYDNREIGSIEKTTSSYQYGDTDLSGYDFGLEQFYIYVDSSHVEKMENNIFKISVTTDKTEQNALSFLDRTEYDGIQVTWKSGLSLSFYQKGTKNKTYISGEISKDNNIQIDTSIQIKADDIYWQEKLAAGNTYIDSENNNKYLDVAIYLSDRSSGEYVTLPANTNIIMNGQRVAVVDKSVTYCYKDWNFVFPIGDITENIEGTTSILLGDGTTVSNECHIELDFSAAEIDDYIDKDYDIYMELRRTSNPDYPLGGDRLDTYSEVVKCIGNKEMAAALNVEDSMDLGINTYHETTSSYKMPFNTRLDFANMISNDKAADIAACADKKYLVTYRLKKKIKLADGTYRYDSIGIDASTADLKLGEQLQLKLDDTAGDTLNVVTYAGEKVYQMVKTFDEGEIKTGTDGVPYVVSWDAELLVNTEDIVTSDFSNYMVEVTILPYDRDSSIPADDKAATLIDYFIFTIGKLKTDM